MAAIFALSLVPTGAFAAADSGDVEDHTKNPTTATLFQDQGKISIANSKDRETYKIWRMLDLASFRDSNPSTGEHPDAQYVSQSSTDYEAYSYVINEKVVNVATRTKTDTTNPWLTFLTTYGKGGANGTHYAYYSDEYDALSAEAKADVYFVIEKEDITLNLPDTTATPSDPVAIDGYHVIRATENFRNAWDAANSTTARNANGTEPDSLAPTNNTGGNPDYSNATDNGKNLNAVQDFAQAAVKYATDALVAADYTETGNATNPVVVNSAGGGTVPLGYYLMGTSMGALASLDTTNKEVSIYEKNDEPTIEKKVLKKGSAANGTAAADLTGYQQTVSETPVDVWVEDTDADINDVVKFRTVITAQQGADSYVLHDVMEDGLELVNTQSLAATLASDRYTGDISDYRPQVYLVKPDGSAVYHVLANDDAVKETVGGTTTTYTASNWVLRTSTTGNGEAQLNADKCDLEIVFKDGDKDTTRNVAYEVVFGARPVTNGTDAAEGQWVEVKDGDKIVVTYWARVKPEAAIWTSEEVESETSAIKVNAPDSPTAATADTLPSQPKSKNDGSGRNDNHTVLTYGNKAYTKFDKASVTTYQLDITKTTEAARNGAGANEYSLLDGAKFSLYKAVDSTEAQVSGTSNLNSGYASFTPKDASSPVYYHPVNSAKLRFLENQTDDGQQTQFTNITNYVNTHTFYRFDGDNSAASTTTLESKDLKSIHLYGLEAGTYVLVEEKAPNGFNKLAHPVVITITGDTDSDGVLPSDTTNYIGTSGTTGYDGDEGLIATGFHPNDNLSATASAYNVSGGAALSTVTVAAGEKPQLYGKASANGGVHVINQTGQELPSTGGIGTTIFYVAGTVLVVGAAVMLVAKRRMGSEA